MRLKIGLCALAAFGSATSAQTPAVPRPASSRTTTEVPNREQGRDSLRLTRRQAIAEALNRNAQLDVAREQTAEARARRVTGNAVPDPILTAAYDQIAGPFVFGGAPSKPVNVGLDVPFPDKFRLNNKIGTAGVRAAESNYRLQQQSVGFQTSAAYDSLLVSLAHRANLQEARALTADFLSRTQSRFNAGTVARLDVIQAQVAVAQADNDLISNERDVANAQASLNRQLGRLISAPIAPTDSLEIPPALPDSSSIEQIALNSRPELKNLEQQVVAAKATTSLTKEFWLPDLTFGVARDYAQPGSPLFTTGISMPLPVLFWQHSRGDIALAQHTERELDATYRDTRAQVIQDVRSSYANASTAIRQAIFLRDQLVPSAREAYRVSSTSYSLGGSSALEVLTARAALLQAESQLLDALAAASTARADLDRALGNTLPNGSIR